MTRANRLVFGVLTGLILLFLAGTAPLIQERTSRENVAERQAQTAGMIRMYCQDSSRHPWESPNIPFGKRPFNLELSVFEWAQGRIAAAIDGPKCDSVEVIGRATSVLFSAATLAVVFALGTMLAGTLGVFGSSSWLAGLIGAFLLSTDFLWLKFSSFTLVDNRMIFCGMLAYYLSLRQKWVTSALFWGLCICQKPQAFAFIGPYFVILDLVVATVRGETRLLSRERLLRAATLFGGIVLSSIYYIHSVDLNKQNDVPWLAWTGPRAQAWFFGDWQERLQWAFYKSTLLDWIKKSGLVFVLPTLAVFAALAKSAAPMRPHLRNVLLLSLPFLAGRFFNVFVFLNVFKAHDYYALPLNAFAALTKGLLLGYFVQLLLENTRLAARTRTALAVPAIVGLLLVPATMNVSKYVRFAVDLNTPDSPIYDFEWNQVKMFPSDAKFVVVAQQSSGRGYSYLYLAKQTGHIWCAYNKEFAPRAFWKAEGVQYVAWQTGHDPVTRQATWEVRSIEEELALARQMGWSSDVDDVWAGKTMAEWSEFASRTFQDPCVRGFEDPRKWRKE